MAKLASIVKDAVLDEVVRIVNMSANGFSVTRSLGVADKLWIEVEGVEVTIELEVKD